MSANDHGHDDHGHGHAGQSRFIQHHYDDAVHQFDAGKLGIWIFLAQEVLFFSALFVAYILYRVHHPEIYSYAHKWLDVKYGAINTAVLITSSLTAAWAVRAAQLNQRRLLIACLGATVVFACTFLGIKYIEYSHKWHEQILFGRYFDPCISPGGEELITKKNKCAGTKSTVIYDPVAFYDTSAKPQSGCFDVAKLDLDPERPGVQAKCEVTEVKLDDKGQPTGASRPITEQCEDELNEALERIESGGGEADSAQPGSHAKFPCWRPSYQPGVCPDGANTGNGQHARSAGGKPQVGILVEYGDREERHDVRIEAKCEAPKAPAVAAVSGTGEPPAGLEIGERAIRPIHEITTHEEHELESLGPPPEHTSMFLTVYFAMTGLHGIHVFVGVCVFIWLLRRAVRGDFTPEYFGPIDFAALYWHIVDLIWIFLFPLLYLIH